MSEELIKLAAEAIADAHALLIAAGAGMGVDSGLPDFRGPEGISILTCWDADRLDLPRIGAWIKRHFLCTEPAKAQEMVDWAVKRSKAGFFPWADAFAVTG